jgi:ATP/maltotriose-dependent transcriptional regulator MalT
VAIARGEGILLTFADHARALLSNGLGRYGAALPAAESASAPDELTVPTWSLPELVEAAARSGAREAAAAALERLTERTHAADTDLARGIEARCRALVSDAMVAEELYLEALDRLGRCRFAPDHARAHLLYGEWLRREGRQIDAREQLHAAYNMLGAIGMEAFAERARRELLETGEAAPRRTADARDELTAQEAQIALLAREGGSNAEIGAQLFLSPRTVEWHLHKVFTKLGIGSRKELGVALRGRTRDPQPV